MLSTLKTIILFVLMLSIIALVHEFGHLITAKLFGVYCKEFSIGMGPKLFSIKGKETEYSFRALLIGGYVSMVGENSPEDEDIEKLNIPKERTLVGISKFKRAIVMVAGIFMNFVLAWLVYSLIIFSNGTYVKESKPVIALVNENSPAYLAGLKENDVIESVEFDNGLKVNPDSYTELLNFLVSSYDGEGSWHFIVNRNNESVAIDVIPEYNDSEQRYIAGISMSNKSTDYIDVNIFNCFIYGFSETLMMCKIIFETLIALFRGIGLNNLSGPVGIYQVVETTVNEDISIYFSLLALISINAAIINAVPLPILDGGRVVLLLVEGIIRKPLSKKLETIIMAISMALLVLLMLYTTYNDIGRIIGG